MTLQDWLQSSWLTPHKTTPQEIGALLAMSDRDLRNCRASGLDPDWQLSIAYNAALQASISALAAAGYRVSKGESHHHRAIQSLAFTVKCDPSLIAKLDKLRKKRNVTEYERAGAVSAQEADEMIRTAKSLRTAVEAWLKKEHPKLLRP